MNPALPRVLRPAAHVSLLAVLALLFGLLPGLVAQSARADEDLAGQVRDMHAETAAWILDNVDPTVGIGREWQAVGLGRSDLGGAADDWIDSYYDALVEDVEAKDGDLGAATEYARVIIALGAIGKDVTDVGGHDLLEGLAAMPPSSLLNAAIFGLIALDTHNYEIPALPGVEDPTTRQKLVDRILDRELAGGGWTFFGANPDPDMTGMTLQALSRYTDQPEVAAAAQRGVDTLADIQKPSGAFASGVESVESTVQATVALTALGVDPVGDPRFTTESGHNPVSALERFYIAGGGFWYNTPSTNRNPMSTEQGFYGLTDYLRFVEGKPGLYDMSASDEPAPQPQPQPAPQPDPEPTTATTPTTAAASKARAGVRKKQVVLKVRVRAAGNAQVHGKVRMVVKKGKRTIIKRNVRVNKNGVATLKLKNKRILKALKGKQKRLKGKYRVNAKFLGNKTFAAAKVKKSQFRIR